MDVFLVTVPEYDDYQIYHVADNLETAIALIRQPYDADHHYRVKWRGVEQFDDDSWTLKADFARVLHYSTEHTAEWSIERRAVESAVLV